jgi:hypothetical protein
MRGISRMKKLVTSFFIIAMIFMLTACEKVSGIEAEAETPEQAITNIISAVKEVNAQELTRYGAKELIGSTDDLNNTRNKKIFETLEFNINSTEETEDTAIIKVEFKTKDLTSVPQDYADKSAMLTMENNNLGENKLDDVAMKQKFSDLFVDVIDKCEYTEFKEEVDVYLTKEGKSWKLNLETEFQNAIYGNMIVSQNTVVWPEETTGENTKENSLERQEEKQEENVENVENVENNENNADSEGQDLIDSNNTDDIKVRRVRYIR